MWLPPLKGFGVLKDGIPLEQLPWAGKSLGIEVAIHASGAVPLFEEHSARILAGYNLHAWYDLTHMERALEVCHYRQRGKIESFQMKGK